MIKAIFFFVGAFLLATSSTTVAAETSEPQPTTAGPISASDGSQRYVYSGRVEPTLGCRPLYVCDISLESGESVLNLAIGDSVRWVVAAAESGPGGSTPEVFVKPTTTNLETNLVITTTRRVYHIRLTSSSVATNPRISYSYPEEQAPRDAEIAAQEKARDSAKVPDLPLLPPDQLDSSYKIEGDRTIGPDRVYNDGVHSYIEFQVLPNDLPVLLAVAPDGSNQIVNYRLQDRTFIVDGVPSGFDLVLNAGTGKHGRGERRCFIRHK